MILGLVGAFWTFIYRYGAAGTETPYTVVRMWNGYVMFGHTNSFSSGGLGYGDFFMIKTDTFGNIVWEKVYGRRLSSGTAREDHATWMERTSDGGFVMVGYTGLMPYPADTHHIFIIKTDVWGNVQWAKRIGASPVHAYETDKAWDVIEDGGYVIVGQTDATRSNPAIPGDYDAIVIKLSSDGSTILWQKRLGRFRYGTDTVLAHLLFDVEKDPSGNYVIVGRVEDSLRSYTAGDPEDWDMYVVKMTPSGDTVWTRRYRGQPSYYFVPGNRESAIGVTVLPSGNFIVGGYSNTWESPANDPSYRDILIMKVRGSDGAVLWAKRVVSNGTMDRVRNLYYSNGYVYVAGEMAGDAVLIKMDTSGNLIWAKEYATAGYDVGRYAIPSTVDGDDHTVFLLSSGGDAFLLQLDSSGNYLRPAICGNVNTLSLTLQSVSVYDLPTRDSVYDLNFTVRNALVAVGNGMTVDTVCPLGEDVELVVGEREVCRTAVVVGGYPGGIKFKVSQAGNYTVRVYDPSGRLVGKREGYLSTGEYSLPLTVSGSVFVDVRKNGKRVGVFKVILRK